MTLKSELDAEFPLEVTSLIFGVGSLFTMEHAGSNHITSTWIYLCDWDLTTDVGLVASSDNVFDSQTVKQIESCLVGASMISVSFAESTVKIEFGNRAVMRLLGNPIEYDRSDDLVMFFKRGGRAICFSLSQGLYEGE